MTELEIQQQILLTLGSRPDVRVWRTGAGKGRSMDGLRVLNFGLKGCADITGVLMGGRALFIEVKKPGGRQSPDQMAFQGMVEKFGGLYILAHSVDEAVRAVEVALG